MVYCEVSTDEDAEENCLKFLVEYFLELVTESYGYEHIGAFSVQKTLILVPFKIETANFLA